jgi:peptide/nickel transport system ATP-binding protein
MEHNERDILLEVRNLKTYFKTDDGIAKAVDNISFTIYRGETVGIVGESGSGKSVTCLSIMRLISSPPGYIAGGEILYHRSNGDIVDLAKVDAQEMRSYRGNEISMIFQEPMTSLNPVYTCGDQVMEAILLHQDTTKTEAQKLTLELFGKVELPDPKRVFGAYPHQLSGGQMQRVMIAMALSCNPNVLIADEPTTALDVTVQKTILQLMDELRKEIDASIIFITHDLGVIAEIADRVIVMYKGHIVEEGNVLEIFVNPKHPYTKSLLACRPPLKFRMKKLPVVSDFMDVTIDENGDREIIAKDVSIDHVINKYKVKPSETSARMTFLKERKPILEVKGLKTYFPAAKNFWGKTTKWVRAVDDVSFKLYPGETLGLVGESGCGKTTLGRSIIRLVEASAGEVLFEGQDILKMTPKQLKKVRKDVQIIFQDPYSSLNPRMTIGNAIMEPMRVHDLLANDEARKAKVIELLETVSLEGRHFNRYPHEFSGGQRQRICVARALALQPRFIICDESVSALDVSVQAQVLNLLLELRNKFNFTYIFISHDLSVVKFMSDRMIVMNKGKIEEMDTADNIYNSPKKVYTQNLISAIPKGQVEDIKKRMELSQGL